MELHTLGVDGGYTQADVQEVARALTGWTLSGLREGDGGRFEFNPLFHAEGDKIVLGEVIPSGGMDEGRRILRILARHPSTAHFVSTKLVRRFVADDPPANIVEAAAERFLETDGDIREVLRRDLLPPRLSFAQVLWCEGEEAVRSGGEWLASGRCRLRQCVVPGPQFQEDLRPDGGAGSAA